jgi:hypothetical protein
VNGCFRNGGGGGVADSRSQASKQEGGRFIPPITPPHPLSQRQRARPWSALRWLSTRPPHIAPPQGAGPFTSLRAQPRIPSPPSCRGATGGGGRVGDVLEDQPLSSSLSLSLSLSLFRSLALDHGGGDMTKSAPASALTSLSSGRWPCSHSAAAVCSCSATAAQPRVRPALKSSSLL